MNLNGLSGLYLIDHYMATLKTRLRFSADVDADKGSTTEQRLE